MAKKPAHYVSEFPYLITDWDFTKNADLRPETIATGSNKKVWWKCAMCGHEWQAVVSNRTDKGSGCPMCAKHRK